LPGIGGGKLGLMRSICWCSKKSFAVLQKQFSCSTSDQQHLYRATGTSDNGGLNYSGSLSPLDAGKVFFLISMQLLFASAVQLFFLIQLDYAERYICHDGFGADDS
jgi:hypothetical protein